MNNRVRQLNYNMLKYSIIGIAILFISIHDQKVYSQSMDNMKVKTNKSMKSDSMKMGKEMEMEEVAHPFLSHMGVPEAVGMYSLRLSGLFTNNENKNDGDFAFHFETGLTDFIGLHVRNDGFLDRQHTEVMLQFAAFRNKNKMSGFSPLIEFEFPTKDGGDRHTNILIGFTTALANSKMAFNQALHYNPREEEYEFNASYVVKVGSIIFPVVEIFSEALPDEKPLVNLLGGIKVKISDKMMLGIALQVPVTEKMDYTWQLIFQPDIEWRSNNMKK